MVSPFFLAVQGTDETHTLCISPSFFFFLFPFLPFISCLSLSLFQCVWIADVRMLRLSYPVRRWHGVALYTPLTALRCTTWYLCRSFVTAELVCLLIGWIITTDTGCAVSVLWVCCECAGCPRVEEDGLMWRTHTRDNPVVSLFLSWVRLETQ